jgi:hypothetical protein
VLEEGHGFPAIDDAMVVGQGDIHDRANDDVAIVKRKKGFDQKGKRGSTIDWFTSQTRKRGSTIDWFTSQTNIWSNPFHPFQD